MGEAYTENSAGRRVFAAPESWYSFEMPSDAIIYLYADDFVCAFQYASNAERFYKVLPKRLEKFNLQVAEDKARLLRFSCFHPALKSRFCFLSFEFYWDSDTKGKLRLFRRTGRKMLQTACDGTTA